MIKKLIYRFPFFGPKLTQLEGAILELKNEMQALHLKRSIEIGEEKNSKEALEKENEYLLVQLFQAQADIDKPSPEVLSLRSQIDVYQKQKKQHDIDLLETKNSVASLERNNDALTAITRAMKSEIEKYAEKNESLATKVSDQVALVEENKLLIMQRSSLEKSINELRLDFESQIENQTSEKNALLSSINDENSRLLKNLHQVQEELERVYLESSDIKKDLEHYIKRWQRLEIAVPNYMDVGSITVEFRDIDGEPSAFWTVQDYFKSNHHIDEFTFITPLKNGVTGIKLAQDSISQAFYPSMLATTNEQVMLYTRFKFDEIRKIEAAINVLELVLVTKYRQVGLGEYFDPQFWSGFLSRLISDFRKLPKILRYSKAKLKLEVNNVDYENLWLEVYDMSCGAYYLPKFEVRIGAAMVEKEGFSQYPKIEIPLVDGIQKPFKSWYPESVDTYGQKLELRFDIQRQIMDLQVWSKLAPSDIGFVCEVIAALPRMLINLRDERISISRDWQVWIEFAAKALGIVNMSRKSPTENPIESKSSGTVKVDKAVEVLESADQLANLGENLKVAKNRVKNSVKKKPVKSIVVASAKKRIQK